MSGRARASTTAGRFGALSEATDREHRLDLAAAWILNEFETYYRASREIPGRAKLAFELRDHATSVALSRQRLSMYSQRIESLGPRLKQAWPALAEDEALWRGVEIRYLPMIEGRYEADLAFAFMNSARRMVYQGEWKPVEYAFGRGQSEVQNAPRAYVRFDGGARIDAATIERMLSLPRFDVDHRDLAGDARAVADRMNDALGLDGRDEAAVVALEMIEAGFYRNRGAYQVGRVLTGDGRVVPFVIALLNEPGGIYVDAVLHLEADVHNIFSSTLANFHVTNPHYHELSAFLKSIMPARPLGLHYSTIGFNHVGKVAVMSELKRELQETGEVLRTAIGFRGTVAIGFSAPSSAYNLKVIRDHPTAQYKWGEFAGIETVLAKYARVHEINRTGSMLDNIIYYNLKLDASWFDPALLEELLRDASRTVFLRGDSVILKYLIVQRRMRPLPVFLESASPAEAETVMVNLGHCIKNNAAANIFNKDLDARNYGVSRFLKVYLYDYDALEPFTDVKIRTNADRFDGEEDVPDWVFEDGVVFLPEEIEAGLMLEGRALRRLFRAVHGDLLTVEYWERIQRALIEGRVPSISVYPEEARLHRAHSSA